jgi:nucleotide-binding universal stress UspA family protein
MTFRNILVQVDNSKAARTRVAAAAHLASRFKCTLTGVFLKSEQVPDYVAADSFAAVPGDFLERSLEERKAETAKASAAARSMFDEAVQKAEIPFYWLDVNGDTGAQLAACARRHDLTILPTEMKPAFARNIITAAEIGMASGGPVLMLKHGGFPMTFGRKILVAWNDSRESARALRDAWPFLEAAEEIHFLTVSRRGEAELDELLRRHLRNHGCGAAKLTVDRNDESPVGSLICRHVGIVGADMVVLGLYGHSRLHEMMLGGASRDLLHDMPMPLFMSH